MPLIKESLTLLSTVYSSLEKDEVLPLPLIYYPHQAKSINAEIRIEAKLYSNSRVENALMTCWPLLSKRKLLICYD